MKKPSSWVWSPDITDDMKIGVVGLGVFGVVLCAGQRTDAEPLAVRVGGEVDFQGGWVNQGSFLGNERHFQNDTELHLSIESKTDQGFVYGARIELEGDSSADARGEGVHADKTYLYLESRVGRLDLGGNPGAQQVMQVDAATIARATGGLTGIGICMWRCLARPFGHR